MKLHYLLFSAALLSGAAYGESSTLDAAIGGGLGGAAGAAIGNELGGRDGAIIGGALGGAVGVAVNTDDKPRRSSPSPKPAEGNISQGEQRPRYYHCPPGQRKKGRC